MRYPDFIVVGASKSGTTSLYHYLKQHPAVFMPENKEPHYFAPAKWCGLPIPARNDYLTLFEGAKKESIVGEASTGYLYYEQSPGMIHAEIPNCRIVAILRNPVDRAFSGYCHELKSGMENVSFEEALAEERRAIRRVNGDEFSFNYMKQGFVHHLLERYIELFGAGNVQLCFFDDLVSSPDVLMRSVFRFLGVDESFQGNWTHRHNATGEPRIRRLNQWITGSGYRERMWVRIGKQLISERFRPKLRRRIVDWNIAKGNQLNMRVETRRMLEQLFAEEIEKLELLTGRNLSAWKKTRT